METEYPTIHVSPDFPHEVTLSASHRFAFPHFPTATCSVKLGHVA